MAKSITLVAAGFVLGLGIGVSIMVPRRQFDGRLVEHCRNRITAVERLSEADRARVEAINDETPEMRLQWRIVQAIAGVKIP